MSHPVNFFVCIRPFVFTRLKDKYKRYYTCLNRWRFYSYEWALPSKLPTFTKNFILFDRTLRPGKVVGISSNLVLIFFSHQMPVFNYYLRKIREKFYFYLQITLHYFQSLALSKFSHAISPAPTTDLYIYYSYIQAGPLSPYTKGQCTHSSTHSAPSFLFTHTFNNLTIHSTHT